ncbi:hypothetical protein X797_005045 [Metarhizium robertsii]|uniref:Uncharacterized protein n=1 Tax=Metarhizium robertsii TaxID=568076 RepID=A0A0A1UV23_9HYPO|nr:hypothetical protein X797_005045 [Metarhizium robertsii]
MSGRYFILPNSPNDHLRRDFCSNYRHGYRGDIPDSTYTQIYYRFNHGPCAELVRGTVSWLIAAFWMGTRYKESVASLMDGVDFRYRRVVIIYKDYDTRLVISSCDDTTTP